MILHGIDVSDYQGEIDWKAVGRAGKRFVWIKLTEGSTWSSRRFADSWRGARGAGLLSGAYHFLTATSSAEEQVRNFLTELPPESTLPPLLDVERGPHGGIPSAAQALAWLRLVEAEVGVRPWVYTGPAFAAAYLRGAPELADHKLVVAHYTRSGHPTVPPPWTDWAAWQHDGDGRCDGIEGPVDLDCLRAEALKT